MIHLMIRIALNALQVQRLKVHMMATMLEHHF